MPVQTVFGTTQTRMVRGIKVGQEIGKIMGYGFMRSLGTAESKKACINLNSCVIFCHINGVGICISFIVCKIQINRPQVTATLVFDKFLAEPELVNGITILAGLVAIRQSDRITI